MSPISQRFPIPTNDDDFEKLCLHLLRHHWSRPGLEIFGKRGERQFGIDILDVGGQTPIYAAQCKLREEYKSLAPSEIQTEVDEAKKFAPPLGKYAILTTGKVSAKAQRKVREINQSHKQQGLFEVEVLTWDRLSALLQQYSDVQEAFYSHFPVERAIRMEAKLLEIQGGVQSLTLRAEGDSLDAQINEARDYIAKREFQLATFLLNRIQCNQAEKLDARQRFRVISNQGAAALGLGKAEAAAKLFLEAAPLQPNDEHAKINEVFAYLLVGDLSTCHSKATQRRLEYPGSARLAFLWLASAPLDVSFAVLESEINSILRSDPEVSVALARRALTEFNFEKASEYIAMASKVAPKWSQPPFVSAQISLGRALHVQLGFRAKPTPQESSLREADELCSRALDLANDEKDDLTKTAALVLRVDIRLLLRKTDDAVRDAEDANRLNAEEPGVMLALAQVRFASGRTDDAIAILQRAFELYPRPDVAFVYGQALLKRGRDVDLDVALRVFSQISIVDLRAELRPTTVTNTVQCFAKKNDWQGAEAYLAKVSSALDPAVAMIMRGYLAHHQGQSQEAEQFAVEARTLLTDNVNADSKESLARLFMIIGRPAEALPLLQELFDKDVPDFDPRSLLSCAAKLNRDDLVMQTCERLRRKGNEDWSLLEFEVQYLEKYKIDVAIHALQSFIAANPDNCQLAKLRLSFIALRLNKPELVQARLQDLPPVEELPIRYAIPAVQVLKYGGDPLNAVDYAYRFLRLHFGEVDAHQALIVSMIPDASVSKLPPSFESVGVGSAVCYQEVPHGIPTWVVIEDTEKPNSDFEEVSATSSIATALIGKKVGDKIVLAKGTMQDRVATILQILPKYVRRYQDSMGEMQVRFGAASTVESVRIEESPEGDLRKGVEVILASVERRAAAVANARDTYTNLPASLHWYGAQFGSDAYQALMNLAAEDWQPVKCAMGTPDERDGALRSLQTAKGVVVDMTALATLRLLNLEKVLSSTNLHFILSERTWITLQERLSHSKLFASPTGTLYFKNGRHGMYEETAADKEQRIRQDEAFIKLLEATCEIKGAPALAALQPEKREALEKFFGSYGAEAMVLASDPDNVLWTDDLIEAQTSVQEFGSRRVWTQVVLGTLADLGLLTVEEYGEANARLLGMEFVATQFDSSCLISAFNLASWSGSKWPAAQVLRTFSNPGTDLISLFKIFVEFTIRLYRESLTAETRCSVTLTFLDIFANRPGGMQLLTAFRGSSNTVFGINIIGRQQFDDCFDRWNKGRTSTSIYLPETYKP
ncbi:MAG TPA: tetratricopeptide repeat protein [Candidatus Acidoferrum sp.]|nr:tetratricopeptide repeat protein [Candidatus Acidoferrum sp.]